VISASSTKSGRKVGVKGEIKAQAAIERRLLNKKTLCFLQVLLDASRWGEPRGTGAET